MTSETAVDRARPAARIREYRARVTRRVLETGLERLEANGDVSEREREVLAAMAWNISRSVVPADPPASNRDAASARCVASLFEDE